MKFYIYTYDMHDLFELFYLLYFILIVLAQTLNLMHQVVHKLHFLWPQGKPLNSHRVYYWWIMLVMVCS